MRADGAMSLTPSDSDRHRAHFGVITFTSLQFTYFHDREHSSFFHFKHLHPSSPAINLLSSPQHKLSSAFIARAFLSAAAVPPGDGEGHGTRVVLLLVISLFLEATQQQQLREILPRLSGTRQTKNHRSPIASTRSYPFAITFITSSAALWAHAPIERPCCWSPVKNSSLLLRCSLPGFRQS